MEDRGSPVRGNCQESRHGYLSALSGIRSIAAASHAPTTGRSNRSARLSRSSMRAFRYSTVSDSFWSTGENSAPRTEPSIVLSYLCKLIFALGPSRLCRSYGPLLGIRFPDPEQTRWTDVLVGEGEAEARTRTVRERLAKTPATGGRCRSRKVTKVTPERYSSVRSAPVAKGHKSHTRGGVLRCGKLTMRKSRII